MKKTKKNRSKTTKYVTYIIVSIVVMLIAACFIKAAAQYTFASFCVSNAEREGKTMHPVAGGQYRNWSDDEIATYNAAMEDKNELIATNDIAKFYSDLSGSTTGRIVRVLLPIAMVVLFIYAALYFIVGVVEVYRRTVRWNKHRIAEKKAKEAEEPEILECVKAD